MEKSQKVTFLKVCHFSIHQQFPDTKTSIMRAMVVEYISKKRGWHKIAKLVNHDRNKVTNFLSNFPQNFA